MSLLTICKYLIISDIITLGSLRKCSIAHKKLISNLKDETF